MSNSGTPGTGAPPEAPPSALPSRPDPEQCRAVSIYPGHDSAWCRTTHASCCRFAQAFANGLICTHPDRQQIIARSRGGAGRCG